MLFSSKSLVALPLLLALTFPAAANMIDASSFYGGVSVTQARWSEGMGFNDLLKYKFDTNFYTKVEGKIASRKTGFGLGVDVDLDNNVGKANRILGYVGVRRVFLRAASSDMKGTATWDNSQQLAGQKQPMETEFKSKYKYVDLIYYFKRIPLFTGIGYTSYALPTEIKAYSKHNGNSHYARIGAYDPDYKVKLYNFVFGFDTFASSVFLDSDMGFKPKDGVGFFFATEDRFGIGNATISPETMQVLKANNPGFTPKSDTSTYWLIENDSNIGLKWTKTLASGARLAIGLGYEFAFLIGDAFSGVADSTTELELQPTHGLIRQGPMTRLYVRW